MLQPEVNAGGTRYFAVRIPHGLWHRLQPHSLCHLIQGATLHRDWHLQRHHRCHHAIQVICGIDPSGGVFPTAALAARFSHTATRLASGKLLATGGSGAGAIASSELYY